MSLIERPYPQYDYFNKNILKSVLYATGYITRRSNFPGTNIERPLALRKERADLYKEMLESDGRSKKDFVNKANEFDRLYFDFLSKQKEVTIEMGELGQQMSRFVILEPKNESKDPLVIIIPGISNDIEGGGDLAIKMAAKGRRVAVIAYPESWYGKVTPQFRDAVEESDKFRPHTIFFGQAIKVIAGDENLIDLWGISTGSLISINLLTDIEFKKRINNSVLIVPPGEENQGNFTMSLGKEIIGSMSCFWKLSQANVCNRTSIALDKKYRKLMKQTYMALKGKVAKTYEWWGKNLLSGSGRKTLVFIGEKDQVTVPIKRKSEMVQNPTISLVSFRQGNHSLAITNSGEILDIAELVQR